jgi:hypothetical protein
MITDKGSTSPAGTPDKRRLVVMSGSFTIGAAGAISSQTSQQDSQVVVSKTAGKTARYDLLTYRPWDRMDVYASIIGPADAAFGNTNANTVQCRNRSPSSTTSQVELQGILASTGADTDFASGTIVTYLICAYGK